MARGGDVLIPPLCIPSQIPLIDPFDAIVRFSKIKWA